MNENDFFREATLRICGNLEIEQAMSSFLDYIQNYIPADRLLLEYFDKDVKAMRTIADATPENGSSIDLITPLSDEARAFLKNKYKDGIPKPYYYDKPNEVSLTRELLAFHKQKAESILVLPLGTSSILVGVVTFISTQSQYNKKHLELVSLLKEPFQIAMSNALKHRNELRLFDRDFFFEVTKRICGTLEIEQGLHECLKYISHHMPAERIYLQRYEKELNAMRVVAGADHKSYELMDQLIPVDNAAKEKLRELMKVWPTGKLPPVLLVNRLDEDPVTQCMLQSLNIPESSAMILPLIIQNRAFGRLVLLSEGNHCYHEKDVQLYALLKVPFSIAMSNTLQHREILNLKDLLADDNRYLQGELHRQYGDEIVGSKYGLKEVMNNVQQVTRMDSPVLLLGETGVGKDVIANAIHYSSTRKDGPFVRVNCGAIPDTLIDSELFGHEKGAFTGALSLKRGRFERAHQGTIFLDEIGELPLSAQVRLLKVLEDKEIERVGGTKTISLDIRIVAATNRNLQEMVAEKQFREDLWFRLNVFPIVIPPLRERIIDIPALIQHFISLKAKEMKLSMIPTLAPNAIESLMNYSWPGNVRELQNIVERALILNGAANKPITFDDLIYTQEQNKEVTLVQSKVSSDKLDTVISNHIRQVLAKTKGKIHGSGGAAELLGINANTLRNRMNKLGIEYGKIRKYKG